MLLILNGEFMEHIISRKEAIEQGLTLYFTGKPCPKGHIVTRKVKGSSCTKCASDNCREWYIGDARRSILIGIRGRCARKNIPFNLTEDDILIPSHCPVLGIPLVNKQGRQTDNTASVDRIIPELGYIKGNVIIVSLRANRIKHNATIQELKQIATFYENLTC